MPDPSFQVSASRVGVLPGHVVTIRCEPGGYGIRLGLTEAEDEVLHGPVFATLPEALAWVDEFDDARAA